MNKDWLLKHTEQHLKKFRLATVLNRVAHSSVYFHKVFQLQHYTLCNFTSRAQFSKSMKIPSSYSHLIKEPPKA